MVCFEYMEDELADFINKKKKLNLTFIIMQNRPCIWLLVSYGLPEKMSETWRNINKVPWKRKIHV